MDNFNEKKSSKGKMIALIVCGAVLLLGAVSFFVSIVVLKITNAVDQVGYIELMEQQYGDKFEMDRYLTNGDFGYKQAMGGIYLNSQKITNHEIMVDTTGDEVMDNYLYCLYYDEIHSYYENAFSRYFPEAECTVETMNYEWLRKTEFMDLESYLKEMNGQRLFVTFEFEEGKVPAPEAFEEAMKKIQSEFNFKVYISAKETYSYCFEGTIIPGQEDYEFTIRDYYTENYG